RVHRFDYESFQARADVGRSHGRNVIFMISENVPNRASFLLSCHAARYGFTSAPATKSIPGPRSRRPRLHSYIETQSLPSSFAATLAALPSISEIPFLDSWFPVKIVRHFLRS